MGNCTTKSPNPVFHSIARELQSLAGNDKSGQLARFRQLYGEFRVFLHRNHYLLMLLKRHIIVLSSHDIAKYDQEQVAEIKKMCEEVSSERMRGPSNFPDFGSARHFGYRRGFTLPL